MKESLEMRKEFGKIVARERKKKGLSQHELAAKMHKNVNYISKIETGRVNITSDYLQLIVNHLECEVEDVLNTGKTPEILYNKQYEMSN